MTAERAADPNVELFAEALAAMDAHRAFSTLSYQEQAHLLISLASGRVPACVHGCGPLHWADDAYECPKCGEEMDLLTAHRP